jgi:hypothetical protein
MSEKTLSFELIEELIKYIQSLNQLIFRPEWNLIYSLLLQHPIFGSK